MVTHKDVLILVRFLPRASVISLISPKFRAPLGQAFTQAGIRPWSTRCTHRVHFPTKLVSGLNCGALKGQASMHALQPVHSFESIRTIPSARLLIAPSGQAVMQGGLPQCMHRIFLKFKTNLPPICSGPPVTVCIHRGPTGRLCSCLQATSHDSHP